jgi:dGTPase
VGATHSRYGTDPVRRYDADLIVPPTVRNQCALLKGMALRYVMRRAGAEGWYEGQRQILTDLVHLLFARAPEALDPIFAPLWKAAPDDASRLRVVIDQVASLTDGSALAMYERLVGSLPSLW